MARIRSSVARVAGSAGPVVGIVGSTTVSPFGLTCGAPTAAMPGSAAMRCGERGDVAGVTPGAVAGRRRRAAAR